MQQLYLYRTLVATASPHPRSPSRNQANGDVPRALGFETPTDVSLAVGSEARAVATIDWLTDTRLPADRRVARRSGSRPAILVRAGRAEGTGSRQASAVASGGSFRAARRSKAARIMASADPNVADPPGLLVLRQREQQLQRLGHLRWLVLERTRRRTHQQPDHIPSPGATESRSPKRRIEDRCAGHATIAPARAMAAAVAAPPDRICSPHRGSILTARHPKPRSTVIASPSLTLSEAQAGCPRCRHGCGGRSPRPAHARAPPRRAA